MKKFEDLLGMIDEVPKKEEVEIRNPLEEDGEEPVDFKQLEGEFAIDLDELIGSDVDTLDNVPPELVEEPPEPIFFEEEKEEKVLPEFTPKELPPKKEKVIPKDLPKKDTSKEEPSKEEPVETPQEVKEVPKKELPKTLPKKVTEVVDEDDKEVSSQETINQVVESAVKVKTGSKIRNALLYVKDMLGPTFSKDKLIKTVFFTGVFLIILLVIGTILLENKPLIQNSTSDTITNNSVQVITSEQNSNREEAISENLPLNYYETLGNERDVHGDGGDLENIYIKIGGEGFVKEYQGKMYNANAGFVSVRIDGLKEEERERTKVMIEYHLNHKDLDFFKKDKLETYLNHSLESVLKGNKVKVTDLKLPEKEV